MKKPSYDYRAQVTRVVDGDTVVADIDLGFRIWSTQTLRLAFINAPELKKDLNGWTLAKAELQRLVSSCTGQVLLIIKRQDKYGRWVADLQMPDGISVSRRLLESGLVVEYKE